MSTHTWEAPADLSSRTDPYLPLYGASILVHFSLLGAIASTISEPVWLPLWAFIGLVGHLVSWRLRRARVAPGTVYLLAIILGAAWTVLAVSGRGDVAGLSEPLAELSPDFSILVLIGGLASIRCFTLLTVDTLLFGVVPALAALGLSAVDNPNAEIPVFFVLILFGGVFCIIQSEYVRRAKELPTRPPLGLPLAVSWAVVGLVFGGGALFALISQPLLAPLNPYQMPMFSRLRQTFTSRVQSPTDTIPVGAGPISLSSRPIYELYAPGGGLYRTGIAESYTGRGWKPKAMRENPVPDGVATVQFPSEQEENSQELYQFTVPPDPEATAPVRRRVVRQRLVVLVRGTRMIPALARPVRIAIPTDALNLDAKNGTAAAGEVMTGGEGMEILSEVRDVGLRELRNAPSVNPDDPAFESTLELPEDLQQVRDLARRLTRGLTGNYAKVQAIIRHIERTCPYTLNEAPTPRGADPVEYYLFQSQRGACDLAGSAAALLCRAVGIPARVAVGYLVDEPLASGDGFLIRGKDAHLWMEAYFPTYGWIAFNPSPPLGSPEAKRPSALMLLLRRYTGRLRSGRIDSVLLALLLIVTGLALLRTTWRWAALWSGRRRREAAILAAGGPQAIAVLYSRAQVYLEKAGYPRGGSTPREQAGRLQRLWGGEHEATAAFLGLTEIYTRTNFAGDTRPEDVTRSRDYVRRLKQRLPRSAPSPASASPEPA